MNGRKPNGLLTSEISAHLRYATITHFCMLGHTSCAATCASCIAVTNAAAQLHMLQHRLTVGMVRAENLPTVKRAQQSRSDSNYCTGNMNNPIFLGSGPAAPESSHSPPKSAGINPNPSGSDCLDPSDPTWSEVQFTTSTSLIKFWNSRSRNGWISTCALRWSSSNNLSSHHA